jgi:hypothetical protein
MCILQYSNILHITHSIIMKKKIKLYPNGGTVTPKTDFGTKAIDFTGNLGKGVLDTAFGALGLTNIIPDSAYQGTGAEQWAQGANTAGRIGQAIAPGALTALGVPAPITQAGIGVLGQVNNMMPAGGMVSNPNVEVEKQENTLNPDGSTTQFDGPSHANGGIPTQLDPNTLVFTDRLKKGNKTYAEHNKKFNTDKEQKMLDTATSKTKRTTAELMMMAKNKQSVALYLEQERAKVDKVSKYAAKIGYKLAYGGQIPKYEKAGMVGEDGEPLVLNNANSYLGSPEPLSTFEVDELNDGYANYKSIMRDAAWDKASKAIVPTAGMLTASMGAMYDLKRAKTTEVDKYDRYTPNLVDPTAALRYNDRVYNKGLQDLSSASGGNAGTYLNNRSSLAANQMYANDQIRQQYANTNAQIQNQAGLYNNNLSKEEFIANAMNRATSRNLKSSALHNIGGITSQGVQGVGRDVSMANRDKQMIKYMQTIYPELFEQAGLNTTK